MVGIYFSGTGNTKYCINQFLKACGEKGEAVSIEDSKAIDIIKNNSEIVFAYPIYFSNLPKIVRDFIDSNKDIFKGKKIFIIATMGLFSGDGTGCSARLLKKYGAFIIGGLHLKMPDCIGDEKVLKKSLNDNKVIVKEAVEKIEKSAFMLKSGNPTKEGLNIFYHIAGLLGQRLWFYGKTKSYTDKLKIDSSKCIGCGLCAKNCPMNNISIHEGKAVSGNGCTMCYRCVNNCPDQAITLLGKKIHEQPKIEKYI